MKFLKKFFLDTAPVKTWYSFLGTLIFFLLLSLLEFGVLYAVRAHNSFGNPFLQALPTFLMLAAIPLIIGGKPAKIYLGIIAFLSLVIEVTTAVIAVRFKVNFDTDFIVVLSATSPTEIVEFIETYYSWTIFIAVIIGILLATFGLFFCLSKCEFRTSWRLRQIGIILCLPFIISITRYYLIGKGPKGLGRSNISRIITGTYDFYRQWKTLAFDCKKPQLPAFSRQIKSDAPITGIIVIGESASRGHFAIYGYPRPTTPELSRRNDLILFTDAIAGWASTTNSLRLMLTCSTLEHLYHSRCSIVDVFKLAGYRVAVLSNQFRWGVNDGPITLMFRHADRICFLQEKARRKIYDDSLLSQLDEELRQSNGQPLIVILHMIGSHDDPVYRYPSTFDPFDAKKVKKNKKERKKNEYDNSIAFTDQVLNQIAQRVAAKETPAFMLFVSDHGSVYAEGGTRSSRSKAPQLYEVPMILQLNQAYRTHYPQIEKLAIHNAAFPIQTDCLFWTMASLAGMQGNENDEHRSPLSPCFQPPKERKIAEGSSIYHPSTEK